MSYIVAEGNMLGYKEHLFKGSTLLAQNDNTSQTANKNYDSISLPPS